MDAISFSNIVSSGSPRIVRIEFGVFQSSQLIPCLKNPHYLLFEFFQFRELNEKWIILILFNSEFKYKECGQTEEDLRIFPFFALQHWYNVAWGVVHLPSVYEKMRIGFWFVLKFLDIDFSCSIWRLSFRNGVMGMCQDWINSKFKWTKSDSKFQIVWQIQCFLEKHSSHHIVMHPELSCARPKKNWMKIFCGIYFRIGNKSGKGIIFAFWSLAPIFIVWSIHLWTNRIFRPYYPKMDTSMSAEDVLFLDGVKFLSGSW